MPAAAGVATVLITALALHGERPQSGLMRFAPAGVLADWPIREVSEVAVGTNATTRTFRRGAAGEWQAANTDAAVPPQMAERIEIGLTLLHNSSSQRILEAGEMADRPLGEFGLAPPRLIVTARTTGGNSIRIEFGVTNPLGLARYARIAGRSELLLLPSFVAEAWERVADAP